MRTREEEEMKEEEEEGEVKEEETLLPQHAVEKLNRLSTLLHSLVKIFKFQLGFALSPKEMNQQRRLRLLIHMLPDGTGNIKEYKRHCESS